MQQSASTKPERLHHLTVIQFRLCSKQTAINCVFQPSVLKAVVRLLKPATALLERRKFFRQLESSTKLLAVAADPSNTRLATRMWQTRTQRLLCSLRLTCVHTAQHVRLSSSTPYLKGPRQDSCVCESAVPRYSSSFQHSQCNRCRQASSFVVHAAKKTKSPEEVVKRISRGVTAALRHVDWKAPLMINVMCMHRACCIKARLHKRYRP